MKKISIIILTLFTTLSLAIDAGQLKEAALKACATNLESIPEEMRKSTKNACECNVNNTDYEAVLIAQKSGDTEQLQKDAIKVAEKCAANLK